MEQEKRKNEVILGIVLTLVSFIAAYTIGKQFGAYAEASDELQNVEDFKNLAQGSPCGNLSNLRVRLHKTQMDSKMKDIFFTTAFGVSACILGVSLMAGVHGAIVTASVAVAAFSLFAMAVKFGYESVNPLQKKLANQIRTEVESITAHFIRA